MAESGLAKRALFAMVGLVGLFAVIIMVDSLGSGDSPTPVDAGGGSDDQEVAAIDDGDRPTLSVEAADPSLEVAEGDGDGSDVPSGNGSGNPENADGDTADGDTADGDTADGDTTGGDESSTDSGGAAASGVNRDAVADVGPIPAARFEPLRNSNPLFTNYADTPSDQLSLGSLTESVGQYDNGSNGLGEFRVACEYSHFSYDDPIVFPNEPGRSHLHMFFGNTEVDAFTTAESLVRRGGGSCNGFELNRSGYWTPALLDGRGNIVVPDQIIVYYKTHRTQDVQRMPQGLAMIAGNTSGDNFNADYRLHWSCGDSGGAYNLTNRIPDCGGDIINATIKFPDCWDGVNLTSEDLTSHMTFGNDNEPCPSSHPVRLPQITILLYYPGVGSVDGWSISSDDTGGFNGAPGGSLHADWWGGWNDETMDLWLNSCVRASRNCSYGQTGTARQLAALNPLQTYAGENYLPIPDGR